MFSRAYEPLDQHLRPGKVLVIYGPRRVGKTTLLQNFLRSTGLKYKLDTGDNIRTQQIMSSRDLPLILSYLEGYELYAIDEAQSIPQVGESLKLVVDHLPHLQIIVTGSSSFELSGQIGEPLTGRKKVLYLYPLAQSELLSVYNRFELKEKLEDFLVFGSYPEVLNAQTRKERIEVLEELAHSYLLKDILVLDRIKSSRALLDLLKLLAFQVGHEVALNELATQLGVNVKTVKRYLDLLEKTFVLYRLNGFGRNLREEVTNKSKYYFGDNGIRNAIVAQFNTLDQRNDQGLLWENFIQIERIKYRTYYGLYGNSYYWRTYQQQEIDLIEEYECSLHGYEFKWSFKKNILPPRTWVNAYPGALFTVIHPRNYQEFILPIDGSPKNR